jgi:hypothetical protein
MLSRVLILSSLAIALGACATATTDTKAVDWNRPFQPATGTPPIFLHDMAIANPPHPREAYVNFWEEPTRFEFRPRNVIYDEETDNGTGGADQGGFEDNGGDMGDGGQ